MGLSLTVGLLASVRGHDEQSVAHYRKEFDTLNRYLLKRNLPVHFEPEHCETWGTDMGGYLALHYLRRLAAHWDHHGKLPAPGDPDAAKDPLLQSYYRSWERRDLDRNFDHLIIHSDAEGYYLPVRLPAVLVPSEAYPVAGGYVGSSPRLLEECITLAKALQLPLETSPNSEEAIEAVRNQGKGKRLWQRYGVECVTLLRLMHGAAHSVRTGAALVFG